MIASVVLNVIGWRAVHLLYRKHWYIFPFTNGVKKLLYWPSLYYTKFFALRQLETRKRNRFNKHEQGTQSRMVSALAALQQKREVNTVRLDCLRTSKAHLKIKGELGIFFKFHRRMSPPRLLQPYHFPAGLILWDCLCNMQLLKSGY